MHSDEINLAKKLATSGHEMDLELSLNHDELLKNHPPESYIEVAIANSLTWTGHAKHEAAYYEAAIAYLSSGEESRLNEAEQYSARFGDEKLRTALKSWRLLLEATNFSRLSTCDAGELCRIQTRGIEKAEKLRREERISGIGAWLFCAPFKLVAIHRKDLWSDNRLDDLLMPLGLEVNRGIRKMIRHKYDCTDGITEEMLATDEGGLMDGLSTISLVQSMSRKLAQAAGSRVLHINSGLYAHGGDKL